MNTIDARDGFFFVVLLIISLISFGVVGFRKKVEATIGVNTILVLFGLIVVMYIKNSKSSNR